MRTISFASVKGGCGKSSISILTANALASAGRRVLFVDLDIQNAASFYYLDEFGVTERHNVALALQSMEVKSHIVTSNHFGVELLPSSLLLADMRTISDKRLPKLLEQVAGDYDVCFIDCPPTYDSIVLNGVNAADLIVTPVEASQFDWKTAEFFGERLQLETDKFDSWRLLWNMYRAPRTDNPESLKNQYEELFESSFSNFLPVRIPESAYVRRAIDTSEVVSRAKAKVVLFQAVTELAAILAGEAVTAERF